VTKLQLFLSLSSLLPNNQVKNWGVIFHLDFSLDAGAAFPGYTASCHVLIQICTSEWPSETQVVSGHATAFNSLVAPHCPQIKIKCASLANKTFSIGILPISPAWSG
jgi:hypothetical protein